MPEDKRPTHALKVLDTETGDHAQVGVGWMRENGNISLKLNPGVVISYDSLKGKILSLFKVRTQEEWGAYKKQKEEEKRATAPPAPVISEWRQQHPEYVRKVHFHAVLRRDCPNRHMGNPTITDNPAKVTCGKCKKTIQGPMLTEATETLQETPSETPPSDIPPETA